MNIMESIAEEKKDGGECHYYSASDDRPQSMNEAARHDARKTSEPGAVTNDNDTSATPKTQKTPASQGANVDESLPRRPPAGEATRKSPWLLLLCASGITSCYLWYGVVQEHLFHLERAGAGGGDGSDDESITLFFLAAGTLSSFALAWLWTAVGPALWPAASEAERDRRRHGADGLDHPLLVATSLAYLSAMAASNESLHYVSYPTCVLAKSAKLIPTMVVGWTVERWRASRHNGNRDGENDNGKNSINAMEWIGAGLITVGIISFQYIQLHKPTSEEGRQDGQEVKGDSPYGLALLGLSLFMDGLLGACQSALKQKEGKHGTANNAARYRAPSAMESMLYINLYATLILLPASHCAGQFRRGLSAVSSDAGDGKAALFFQLILSATLGQVFIFLTIHHFSPLTCTTITTTRKFLTILFSVYKFGHVLGVCSWLAIGVVFVGLYLEIAAKFFERGGESDEAKMKTE